MPGGNLTRCTYMLPGLDGLPWRTATWMPTPRGLFHSTSSGVKRTNPFSSFSADAGSPITASPAIALTAQMNCHLTFMLSSDASFGSDPGGDEVNEPTTPYEHGDERRDRTEQEARHQFVLHHGDAPANEGAPASPAARRRQFDNDVRRGK